ncbi:MAG TPA: hypothetical protein VEK08_13640 [Planctomycetota bacterium]|nr:hypothetical protein [Planctomycetota bacterium]
MHSPQNPRVRFFANAPGKSPPFDDITHRVKRLIIEEIQDDSGECYLLRLDSEGELVWRTLHPSLQETKWYVEFEFGLPEEKWQPYSDAAP